MTAKITLMLTYLGLLCASGTVIAHHSVSGEYDENKKVTLTGTVTKIDWTNPHARVYVDVMQPNGSVANWNLELQAVSVLVRQGWKRDSLNVGDVVTFHGIAARTGANAANAQMITFTDGRKVLSDPTER
jgi:hypothetical protein